MVNGIDYGFTGEVKKIDVSRIRERLDRDSIVVVSNMGYSSSGEVLNCKYAFLIIIILYVFWYDCTIFFCSSILTTKSSIISYE